MKDTPMDGAPGGGTEPPLPPHLRNLARLVTVLTVVMIAGLLAIVALLVIRLSDDTPARLISPEEFALPPGVAVTGYSLSGGYVVITGDDGVIRIYDLETGELARQFDLSDG